MTYSYDISKDNHDEKCKEGQLFGAKLPKGPGKPSAVPFSPAKRVSASVNNITNVTNVPKRLVGKRIKLKLHLHRCLAAFYYRFISDTLLIFTLLFVE